MGRGGAGFGGSLPECAFQESGKDADRIDDR